MVADKVFRKMGFVLSDNDINNIAESKPDSVERALFAVHQQVHVALTQCIVMGKLCALAG